MFLPKRVTARVLNEELLGDEPTEAVVREVREALIPREWTVDHIIERLSPENADDPVVVDTLLAIKAEEAAADEDEAPEVEA